MSSDIPNPESPPRKRMSFGKKLFFSGLMFPTLLLIIAALYVAQRSHTIALLNELENQYQEYFANHSNPGSSTAIAVPVYGTLPWPWDENESDFPSWQFKYFGSIKKIFLYDYRLTKSDLENLGKIESLEELFFVHLRHESLDDLKPLGNLQCLKKLMVETPQYSFNDECMEWIGKLKNLEELHLSDAADVTDDGFAHLENLSNLKQVWIGSSKISNEAIRKLQNASPKLEIHVNPAINLPDWGVNQRNRRKQK